MMLGPWLLGAVWVAYMVFQGRASKRTAPTAQRAQDKLYPLYLLATVLGLLLMLTGLGDLWVLGLRVLPEAPEYFWPGFAIAVLGLALAVWAHRWLGPYWASAIELKTDHKLIQSGPYRFIRHPIYAGIVIAALGSAIASGSLGGAIGFVILTIGFIVKLRREERFIAAAFGDDFIAWRKRSWALVPLVY